MNDQSEQITQKMYIISLYKLYLNDIVNSNILPIEDIVLKLQMENNKSKAKVNLRVRRSYYHIIKVTISVKILISTDNELKL